MDTRRIYYLIKNDFTLKGRLYLMIAGTSFVVLIFYFFNSSFSISDLLIDSNPPPFGFNPSNQNSGDFSAYKFHLIWFPQAILIVTSIFTSLSFSEYYDKSSRNFFLSLPASKLEKWGAKVIVTLILLPLGFLLIYQMFAFLTYNWDKSMPAEQVRLGILDPYLWLTIKKTLLIQCIVFLGATIYKKYAIFKIVLLGFVLFVGYNLIQFISLAVIREDLDLFHDGILPGLSSIDSIIDNAGYYVGGPLFPSPLSLFQDPRYYSILLIGAIIGLFVSFLRFKEIES